MHVLQKISINRCWAMLTLTLFTMISLVACGGSSINGTYSAGDNDAVQFESISFQSDSMTVPLHI